MQHIIYFFDCNSCLEGVEDCITFSKFTIQDALAIQSKLYRKSNQEVLRLVIKDSINIYAQNALLKSLEEDLDVTLEIYLKDGIRLLPTFESRFMIFNLNSTNDEEVENFLTLPKNKKVEKVDKLLKEAKTSDKSDIYTFISSIEKEIYDSGKIETYQDLYKAIIVAKKNIYKDSASIKQILYTMTI